MGTIYSIYLLKKYRNESKIQVMIVDQFSIDDAPPVGLLEVEREYNKWWVEARHKERQPWELGYTGPSVGQESVTE